MRRMVPIQILIFISFSISCNNDLEPAHIIQVDIYLVNESGQVTTSFEEGQIPVAVLEVTNNGKEEARLSPALHYGEHVLLYTKEPDNEMLGSFYSNGQLTNEIRSTRIKGNSKTIISLPWIWTSELKAHITEVKLKREETTGYFPANTFADPLNGYLPKGEYIVRLNLPGEWNVWENKSELHISVR